jgi:hypothetical protein
MESLSHSTYQRLMLEEGHFLWAAGIEDTFITDPWPTTGRTLDEYELTGHYTRWREDLNLFSELGVPVIRYGIPWHRIQPERGRWDWEFPDRVIDRLQELGIQPILDLVHYGLPPWIQHAYFHPDFPHWMAEYSGKVAERYRGRVHCYTPLNEPRVTAWYCGKLGWWPPGARGWRGFVRVLTGVCRGIVETTQRLREVDSEILIVPVDATDLYEAAEPDLQEEAWRRQEIVFLALDLVSGRVGPDHPLLGWLRQMGTGDDTLRYFAERCTPLSMIGINLYPLFSRKILSRSGGSLRTRMPYASADIIDRLADLYWARYQVPLLISETATAGPVKRRSAWLEDSVAAVQRVRARGIPLVGYTWWPLFALVTWGYRQGTHPPEYYLKQMGLWDLRPTSTDPLARTPTPLVERFRSLVQAGAAPVGALAS